MSYQRMSWFKVIRCSMDSSVWQLMMLKLVRFPIALSKMDSISFGAHVEGIQIAVRSRTPGTSTHSKIGCDRIFSDPVREELWRRYEIKSFGLSSFSKQYFPLKVPLGSRAARHWSKSPRSILDAERRPPGILQFPSMTRVSTQKSRISILKRTGDIYLHSYGQISSSLADLVRYIMASPHSLDKIWSLTPSTIIDSSLSANESRYCSQFGTWWSCRWVELIPCCSARGNPSHPSPKWPHTIMHETRLSILWGRDECGLIILGRFGSKSLVNLGEISLCGAIVKVTTLSPHALDKDGDCFLDCLQVSQTLDNTLFEPFINVEIKEVPSKAPA